MHDNIDEKTDWKDTTGEDISSENNENHLVLDDKQVFGKSTYPETIHPIVNDGPCPAWPDKEVLIPEVNMNIDPVVSQLGVKVCLYEILVYGKESDKEAIAKINKRLLDQISRKGAANLIRVFCYVTISDTDTEEEMQAFCIDKCMSKYYSFVTVDTDIKDYVREYIMVIKRLENTMNEVKKLGIKVKVHTKSTIG